MQRTNVSLRWVAALVALALLTACTGAKSPNTEVASVDSSDVSDGMALTTDTSVMLDASGDPLGDEIGGTVPKGAAVTKPKTNPTTPGPPLRPGQVRSTLFTDNEDTVGLTKDQITLCAHAALTYGAAFNTSADDLNVYWTELNENGGVFGREVRVTYENDNYSPDTAVAAATACKARNPFFVLGGIGFDQIPAVRNWAEANRMLYLHHTATVDGTKGQRFSYTPLPSTEKMGEMFGELAAARFKNKRIGILRRNSPNWNPGVKAFKEIADRFKLDIVAERPVENNQANYTQELLDLKDLGSEVVWVWDNALASTQIVKQAKAQRWSPQWMLFPFNLTSQTLNDDALEPPMVGVAMYTAYSKGDYSGSFAAYADDMKAFEAQYREHKPGVDLEGVAGDLLFLNWTSQKGLHVLLQQCGPNCTRNRLIDAIQSLKVKAFPSACEIDFTRPNLAHLGGYQVNVMETYRSPTGKANWRNTDSCVEHLV